MVGINPRYVALFGESSEIPGRASSNLSGSDERHLPPIKLLECLFVPPRVETFSEKLPNRTTPIQLLRFEIRLEGCFEFLRQYSGDRPRGVYDYYIVYKRFGRNTVSRVRLRLSDASSGTAEPSCIDVTEVALVTRSVHTSRRTVCENDDVD